MNVPLPGRVWLFLTTTTTKQKQRARNCFSCVCNRFIRFGTRLFSSNEVLLPTTIFALSSAPGRAALAVIRISGCSAFISLKRMTRFGRGDDKVYLKPRPRQLYYTPICHPSSGELLDKGMAVWIPGPRTYTGDDTVELYVHGSQSIVSGLLDALASISDYRLAEPGEFTKRAFNNGKLDLTEVEGIADLLRSETVEQRRAALKQASGSLRLLHKTWRERILRAVAHLEAFIDFSEDDNLEADLLDQVKAEVEHLRKELKEHVRRSKIGVRLRTGIKVAIVGPPNVGKSSLLNLLCRDPEKAIVTSIPGTTRDSLDVHLDFGGFPVVLTDTAGLRSTNDIVEKEGVARAKKKLLSSDLAIVLVDSSEVDDLNSLTKTFDEFCGVIIGANKVDLLAGTSTLPPQNCSIHWRGRDVPVIYLSCLTRTGYSELVQTLEVYVKKMCPHSPLLTQERHKNAVKKALEHLDGFFEYVDCDIVVGGQKLRNALFELGKITGAVCTEEILNTIFHDFCIGK